MRALKIIILIPVILILLIFAGNYAFIFIENDFSVDSLKIDDCLDNQYGCWDYKARVCRGESEPEAQKLCDESRKQDGHL